MSTYAVGDIQGCYRSFRALLKEIGYRQAMDQLWLVGDLVNRGPDSLGVLRWATDQGDRVSVVLGNHDLHLIARALGVSKGKRKDTLEPVLEAPDCLSLVNWLRERPLIHAEGNHVMVHAGLYPLWSVEKALALGDEVQAVLAGKYPQEFLNHMYGAEPRQWSDELEGAPRLRFIVNAMTRMRFVSLAGELDFESKGDPAHVPPGFLPWFDVPRRNSGATTVVAGHWSTLGLLVRPTALCLDTGCVWGGKLTAVRLEDRKIFQVPSHDGAAPFDE